MGFSNELALLQWVSDLSLKVSVLLAAAGALVWLWRGASAALKHWIWSGALLGALLLPLLALSLPRLSLPVLPQWLPHAVPASVHAHPSAVRESVSPAPALSDAAPTPVRVEAADQVRDPAPAAARAGSAASSWRLDLGLLAMWTWVLGAALILARLALGMACVRWISRRARPILDADWLGLLHDARAQLDVTVPVELWRSPFPSTPMTWGVKKPVILLPDAAEGWSVQKRRAVITHELAHIRRRDTLTQTLAHLACALWWFNPLVWFASRQLRLEREKACDDQVLQAGARASEYARHLLDIASTLRSARMASLATIAMARRSQLEGRLMAILNPRLNRRALTPLAVLCLVLVLGGMIVPLAAVQPWAASAPQAQVAAQARVTPLAESGAELETASAATPSKPALSAFDPGDEGQQSSTDLARAMDLYIETNAQLLRATSQELNSLADVMADEDADLSAQLDAVSGQFEQTHQRLIDNFSALVARIEANAETTQQAQDAFDELDARAQRTLEGEQAALAAAWSRFIQALQNRVTLELAPLGKAGQVLGNLVGGLLDRLTVELSLQLRWAPRVLEVRQEGGHIRIIVDIDPLPDGHVIRVNERQLEIEIERLVAEELEGAMESVSQTLDDALDGLSGWLDGLAQRLENLFD